MKSQKLQILLSVLVFASVCGAPQSPPSSTYRSRSPRTRVKKQYAEACAFPVDGFMSNARKPKIKPGVSPLKREHKNQNVAATKIQAVVRGRQVRKGRVRGASDASSASRGSTPRSASPKKGVASPAEAAAMPVTADFIG